MTEFPMDTPFEDIPEEALAQMPKEELMERQLRLTGNVQDFMVGMALEGLASTLTALARARSLNDSFVDAPEFVLNMLHLTTAESVLADALALISVGRELERFVQKNPGFLEQGEDSDQQVNGDVERLSKALGAMFAPAESPVSAVSALASDDGSSSESV